MLEETLKKKNERTKRAAIVSEVIRLAIIHGTEAGWASYRDGRFRMVHNARLFRETPGCESNLRDSRVQLSAYREAARILRAAY